jgi:DNA-binding response OmpR family regulator
MKPRILLVDDELAIVLTIKAILTFNGYDVETAPSAPEATQKLATGVFDLVLTGMNMETPTSGFDVVSAAREQSYAPAIAIFTAHPPLAAGWENKGAQKMFVKPVSTQHLLRGIEELLRIRGVNGR